MTTAHPEVPGAGRGAGRPGAAAGALARQAGRRLGLERVGVVGEAIARPATPYYLLVGATSLLLTIGLLMVLSASSVGAYEDFGDSYYYAKRQLTWVLLGLVCAVIASRMSTSWVRRLAYPGYLFSLALLVATAFLGRDINGNQNWLVLGPIQIQPSEIAKLGLVLWAAHIYANKERRLESVHHMLVPVVPGMVLAAGLVVVGGDLGTGLVFAGILLGMLWIVGAPMRMFVMFMSVAGVGVLVLVRLEAERLARITNFLDPFADYEDSGWQPVHGLFALSSGGVLGEGLGASQQKWGTLPEAHTDYIFAVLGEELGLIGTLLVVGLFLVITYACVRIGRETTDPFVRYLGFGIMIWLLGQMIINVGMVLGLLPVIGIPLPLISSGGSAMMPTLVALGLLIGCARRESVAGVRRRGVAPATAGRDS